MLSSRLVVERKRSMISRVLEHAGGGFDEMIPIEKMARAWQVQHQDWMALSTPP